METPIYKTEWDKLTPKQKALREKSLAVLVEARRTGKSPNRIAKKIGISFGTVQTHTNAFKKVNGRWVAKRFDKIPRPMLISEKGKLRSISISDSRHASTLGRYHNAVKHYLNTGDVSKLKKFSKKKIRDSSGKLHTFETDPKLVQEINERIEEIAFFQVYDS
ncbi:MAG: DNA-binding response regulator [Nitrosopumilaceae archaeon]|nr:DNA-binding response regulator [Nitrososphaeria archaeon]NDB52296.1 DNA-binding response regulator [Nitrosopumilaceae archaeon]NDF25391.1 DNA-binding response regulator [Nitrososphaerota archaeon]NDB62862.1 DNA-binding response regulator [Nitrosopumilaceae archaeon]NDF27564.1 DNA-binding response regulator [Nitrosopumilaceae archaeon]